MARIAGIDLPGNKRVEIALTYIYGIGRQLSKEIIVKGNISLDTKLKDLTDDELNKIRTIVEKEYEVEGNLRSKIAINIKRLMDIGVYRGLRHRRGLPVRGQKTKTNARTRKGRRNAVAKKKK